MAYGVVEFNHVAAQKTGRIGAQLPVDGALATAVSDKLENGMILVYDEAAGVVRAPGVKEDIRGLRLHKSAEKLYDKFANELGDFALDLTQDVLPRLYTLEAGDVYTVTLPVVADGITFADNEDVYVEAGTGKITNTENTDQNTLFGKVVKLTTGPNGIDDAIKIVVV